MTRGLSYRVRKTPHHSIPTANDPSVVSSMNQMDGIHKLLSLQPLHNAQTSKRYAVEQVKLYFWRESAPIQVCEKQTLGYTQHQLREDIDFLCMPNLLQSCAGNQGQRY